MTRIAKNCDFRLSTRWRLVPLNLIIDDDLSCWESLHMDAMSNILYTHPGPVRLLFIAPHAFSTTIGDKLHEWFQSSALDGLECLMYSGGTPKHKLPLSASPPRCASSALGTAISPSFVLPVSFFSLNSSSSSSRV